MTQLLRTPLIRWYERVLNLMGYQLFDDCNLITVHNTHDAQFHENGDITLFGDRYDDEIVWIYGDRYKRGGGSIGMVAEVFPGTSQPGKGVLEEYYQGTNGAGTIAPGRYPTILTPDKWGDFDALLQREGRYYYVFRDGDKNDSNTLSIASVERGSGFQYHRRRGDREHVKRSFGGCRGTLQEAHFERSLEIHRRYNSGPNISETVIYSHWLNAPDEQVAAEWNALKNRYQEMDGARWIA